MEDGKGACGKETPLWEAPPRVKRVSSTCSTTVSGGRGRASSSMQDSHPRKPSGPRSRSTSGLSDQDNRHLSESPSWCSSRLTEHEEADSHSDDAQGSGAGLPTTPELQVDHHAPRKDRLENAARSSCLFGAFSWDFICQRLFGSDTVEYDFGSLEKVADLGQGTFGTVTLVWCHRTHQCLALKAISKSLLVKRRLQSATRSEKMIMKRLDSPFITRLAATFNRAEYLYILMEAARGGDLHEVYVRQEFWGSEPHAQFYSACMVNALAYMHDRRIIYRDLKMENVVLTHRGYAKLCDFGMARFLWPSIGSAYTLCGTPEYKAPEINKGQGYHSAVDWWALGVLIYEMLVGSTPFLAESVQAVYEKSCRGIDEVIPESETRHPFCLVRELCQLEPRRRLPVRAGVAALRKHAWFQDPELDWSRLQQGHLSPPYDPNLEGDRSIGHFCLNMDQCYPDNEKLRDTDIAWADDYEDPVGPAILDDVRNA